ncbi:MAG TPA: OPT family oligopeptide transporter [Polyangia bacterium]|nr:OPT family oligopeptide transporter [Polyangia bacterium]
MSEGNPAALPPPVARGDRPEFSLRAILCSILVAAIIGGSYPYIVLKLGFGPNISVVSAFFGYLLVVALLRQTSFNRWENNIVQTAGTSAGQTAFMCVLLAAFDMLNAKPELGVHIQMTFWQVFAWLVVAGAMGVLMAVPMRRHFIDEEELTYADGVAAAETLVVLDAGGTDARRRARALAVGAVAATVLTWFRDGWPRMIKKFLMKGWVSAQGAARLDWLSIPDSWFFGALGQKLHFEALHFGLNWSLLSIGSGMLVGLRINLSMGLGMVISWLIAPPLLKSHGIIDAASYGVVLRWVMWPATGLMISGGLTALTLRWKLLVKTFTSLSSKSVSSDDFPMKWVGGGLVILSVALVFVQKISLGIAAWQTLVAILLSVPLMLVSLRVLGETNWGPISTMGNMMQAVFALLAPGHIPANMTASGMTGSIAAGSEGIMQCYKTGKMIGSNNRILTWAQLLAVPIGAAAVALVYPVLASKYGVGGEHGLTAPTAVKWAGFAEILSKGFQALPKGCLTAFIIAVIAGILLTLFEQRFKKFLPSASATGLGMLLPGVAILMMVLGGVIEAIWRKLSPKSAEEQITPMASGFIAGEAILAVIIPILMVLNILPE